MPADTKVASAKRVVNPERHDRFRNEIEAVKRLDHPNIIKLIDHSALDAAVSEERQFLVMPVAAGGDLSKPDRLGLYKGSIDAVLQVAKQIAEGLRGQTATTQVIRVNRSRQPVINRVRIEPVTLVFRPDVSVWVPFKVSEWQAVFDALQQALGESIESFLNFVANGAPSIGA